MFTGIIEELAQIISVKQINDSGATLEVFSKKVIDSVRKAVGDDFIVGIRLVADEDWELGLSKKEGLDIVLTCMGTIGFEYALFNKTVVNASIHNPHYLYNFNLNPNNLIKYKYILNYLKKYKKMKINKNQIYMYYFMMHIFHPKNWLFNKIEDVEKKCGSYYGMYSSQIYQCFKGG